MKRFLALLGVIIVSGSARAAVAEGENLLVNGAFDAEQVAFPEFWSPSSSKNVLYRRAGGPEGKKAAIVLQDDGKTPGTVSLRQQGMTLVAGETYRLSAYLRTKGFKSRHAGLIIHNGGWVNDIGFKDLPAESDWTFMERTFALFPSKDKEYGVALFAVDMTGELHCADVKLEAISAGARQGSSSQMSLVAAPRLVPFKPLLNRIPRSHPELSLRFFGVLPEKPDAYECLVALGGNRIPPQTVPLNDGKVVAALAGLPGGDYSLVVTLRHRETGTTVTTASYPISIVDPPAIDRSRLTQLNNLVVEVLNEPVKGTPAAQNFTFTNPRDGWVFVALVGSTPTPGLSVRIDDRDTVITAATDRLEAFRELPMGDHRIAVNGATAEGRLVVRAIAEIFDYPPCVNSYVKENGSYGWDFMKRHILYAVTTLNGGALPDNALPEAKALGLKWLANFNVAPVDDPANVRERMEKHDGMTQPQYDGITSDELFFGRATIDNYTKALWQLANPESRLVYTWIVSSPASRRCTDFMSPVSMPPRAAVSAFEDCHPQADEKAAAAYLDNMVAETMRRFSEFFPNAAAGTGIIFGNFNQIPIISLEHDPAVDFKYYLDMQVNLVANDPAFAGLATTGYWGTYYGDEELARWSFMLMRHYAVEGNKDMLSSRYGFRYNPGFLANCDFADGLQGWDLAPAGEGSIRTDTIAGYGKNSQGRWGGGNAGDSVCVLSRTADKANRISQTARGLEVGKAYCLQFVTADRKDIAAKKYNPRRYGIDAELDGAEILPGRGFVHIDKRNSGRYEHNDNVAKINLNRVVFRARTPTQVVAFTDAKALPGEELVINFVQLKPYLE